MIKNNCKKQETQTATSNKPLLPVDNNSSKLLTYQPAFNLDFVERLLGRRRRLKLPRSTKIRLDTMQKRLTDLIRPRVTYEIKKISKIGKSMVTLECGTVFQSRKMAYSLKGADKVVCFIATVGQKVDREINSLMHYGELANGYVADALGSGAVEQLADSFQSEIARVCQRQGQTVGLRFSPGYCDWPVIEQHKLFSLMNWKTVGVELGETSLMSPRKSISAVFGIYDEAVAPEIKTKNPCLRCAKKDCIARRTEAQTTVQ